MIKKLLCIGSLSVYMSIVSVFAFMPKEISQYFNGPTVSSVASTSASVALTPLVLAGISEEEKSGIYFEYSETHQMCIMMYPTPEYCLPKKTEIGKTQATLSNLKPSTSYTITYKRDNTIRCITTPCPSNEFQSLSVEFSTSPGVSGVPPIVHIITKNLGYGSRGVQVIHLQTMLIERGYLRASATGYFGVLTFKAVRDFQKANYVPMTGFVGPCTRAAIVAITNIRVMSNPVATSTGMSTGEYFEGVISAFSTSCFSDGICSVTVGGKTIIITSGWNQTVVGQLQGVKSISSLDTKIGSYARVYAKKIDTGYTLYGSADYYVLVQ